MSSYNGVSLDGKVIMQMLFSDLQRGHRSLGDTMFEILFDRVSVW